MTDSKDSLGTVQSYIEELQRIRNAFEQAAAEAKADDDALALVAACRVRDRAIEDDEGSE